MFVPSRWAYLYGMLAGTNFSFSLPFNLSAGIGFGKYLIYSLLLVGNRNLRTAFFAIQGTNLEHHLYLSQDNCYELYSFHLLPMYVCSAEVVVL